MKRLNLRTPKPYDLSDQADTIEERKHFFCVSEGATEESYFSGVRNNREKLDIKGNVFIYVVPKEEGQETFSHPMQLVNACLYYMGRIDDAGNEIPENEWEENCKWKEFDPEIDVVCVIFDRDYRKISNLLEKIFNLCEKHGIRIVLSNPNFELWLLMHFPDIEQYDMTKLLDNRKNLRHELFEDASTSKKYLEILVSKQAEGYKKGNRIDFDKFLPNIDLAIRQATQFQEESEKIIEELGTAVGKLLRDMKN